MPYLRLVFHLQKPLFSAGQETVPGLVAAALMKRQPFLLIGLLVQGFSRSSFQAPSVCSQIVSVSGSLLQFTSPPDFSFEFKGK